MGKICDWINRQRHNRGFGIQSPSTFFFVTQVLKEKLPYYVYPILEAIAHGKNHKAKHLKELFRITNHYQPSNIISIGSHTAACALVAARPSVASFSIDATPPSKAIHELLTGYNSKVQQGDITTLTKLALKETRVAGMIYIGNCAERKELLEAAIPYTDKNSIIVIEGIRSDKATQIWWKSVIEDQRTIITFDFYNTGMLLFNKERFKQHYILKR